MEANLQKGKRVPIRKRVLIPILIITLALLAAAIITCVIFMDRMTHEGEAMLSAELTQSLSREVEQKATKTVVMLERYKSYVALVRDYTETMYRDWDNLVATGKFVDSSRDVHEYAMQSAFASDDYVLEEHLDEMYFFSHLEAILEPLAKANEDRITTLYLGTKSGLMIAYDRMSYLAAVPEPEFFVYDYFKTDWYQKGMEAEDVIYTSLYVDALGRGLTITVAAPFRDQNGEVQGVFAADLDITGIYDEMISMDLGDGSTSFAFDRDGRIIDVDATEEAYVRDYVRLDETQLQTLTAGESGIIQTADAFYAFAPIPDVELTLCAVVPRAVLMERANALESSSHSAMLAFLVLAAVLVAFGVFFTNRIARSITYPIELLVDDMQIITNGDLEHKATAYRNDEIGDMTLRLNEMVERLKATIQNLVSAQETAKQMSELANKDALTSLRNKGAFDSYMLQLQKRLDEDGEGEFAVVIFDCNNLKGVNDRYGHDKGDEFLKTASRLICQVFKHSPVFRIGGDEFAAVLQNRDFRSRAELAQLFTAEQQRVSAAAKNAWEQVHVAAGIAVYDPKLDRSANDTVRRADTVMYENKRAAKQRRK